MEDEGYFNGKHFLPWKKQKKCKKNVRLPWKTKVFLTITSFLPWKTTKKQEITLVFHGRHKKRNKGLFPNRSAKSWWCLTLCKTLRGLPCGRGREAPEGVMEQRKQLQLRSVTSSRFLPLPSRQRELRTSLAPASVLLPLRGCPLNILIPN